MIRRQSKNELYRSAPFQVIALAITLVIICLVSIAPSRAQERNATSTVAAKRPWTVVGSSGTVDEDSLTTASLTNFVLGINPGMTGTVSARYNIVPTHDLSQFCPATSSHISIRFRDDDTAGTQAQVLVKIHQTNIASGADTVTYTFDSNVSALALGSAFQTYATDAPIDFNFTTSVYWVEGQVSRSNANRFVNLGSIQIFEGLGTPCP